MSLCHRFADRLKALRVGKGRALVAVSGGLDSVVLLDLLLHTRERHGLELVVAHADHGIHPDSAMVARRVEALARTRGVDVVVGHLRLGPATSETRARAARYRWLREQRRKLGASWIVTAHQADDQRETVLMRFLRGSAPVGLAGMRPRERGIVRPLLGFSRATLLRYARRCALAWWEDPANADPRNLRSWIRTAVLPVLSERLPDLPRRLGDVRRHAARDRRGWDAALRGWPGLDFRRERTSTVSVSWVTLSRLPAPLAVALAEALVRSARGPAGPARVRRALASLRSAQSGASVDIGQGWRFELGFGRLRVIPRRRSSPASLTLEGRQGQTRWGPWRVRWVAARAPAAQSRDGLTAWFIPGSLALRPWRPGDRIAPLAGRGHRLAVRCFQDARVPRSERSTWPVFEGEGHVAWIPGVCRSALLLPAPGTPALRVDVEPRG
jgi:tRNA(Ile)-lysidine synthase